MENENIGKPQQRELNFYERNNGKAVNLEGDKKTWSGDIASFDAEGRMVILRNYINRKYSLDGSSRFIEDPTEYELDIRLIGGKGITTREDRLGRIIKYNRELD